LVGEGRERDALVAAKTAVERARVVRKVVKRIVDGLDRVGLVRGLDKK
jgi:hypothetical protein